MLRNTDYHPPGINNYVPAMQYDANYHLGPVIEYSLGVITPTDVDGIHTALAGNAALTAVLYRGAFNPGPGADGAETKAKFGRCVTLAPGGAPGGTGYSCRVHGEDYIGQPMAETLLLPAAGTATLTGSKAFKRITKIVPVLATGGAVSINVGWGDKLGLPYKVGQFVGGSEGAIDTGMGGVVTDSVAFAYGTAVTVTIVSPVDGYCTGVGLECGTANSVAGTVTGALGSEYNLTVPVLAAGQSISNQVDPGAWVAVTAGQACSWTSIVGMTGGVGTLFATFTEGGTPVVTNPDLTDPATATSKDPRGTYLPYTAPDGVKEYKVRYIPSSSVNAAGNGGLQGIAHYNV